MLTLPLVTTTGATTCTRANIGQSLASTIYKIDHYCGMLQRRLGLGLLSLVSHPCSNHLHYRDEYHRFRGDSQRFLPKDHMGLALGPTSTRDTPLIARSFQGLEGHLSCW